MAFCRRVFQVTLFQVALFQVTLLLVAVVTSRNAPAQTPVLRGLTGIQIQYDEPTNPAHRRIYDRMRKRQVLEQFKEFMSPLKLPRPLYVSMLGCNGVANAFYRDGRIQYCYELVAQMESDVAATNLLAGFRREDALLGGFVSTLLHETGHAIFHLLDIPVFGREEDAADAAAAYVALQFGDTTARRILTGTAFVWHASELMTRQARPVPRFEDYADDHGTDAQRFYNTLCVALGRDVIERTSVFGDFIRLLPERRRLRCPGEYLHVKNSFGRYVLPHVDLALMKKVRSTEWLRSEDGSDVLPPAPLGPRGRPGPASPGPLSPSSPPTPGNPR